MPARRRELLSSFRRCLWRSRLGRLYVQTHGRLQRCPVGSALYRNATDLSRRNLSDTGGDLIDASRYLLLTRGDAGGDLVGAARRLLLTGSDTLGDLVDAKRYLLFTAPDLLHALPDRVERHSIDLLLIERRGGWRRQGDHAGGGLRG